MKKGIEILNKTVDFLEIYLPVGMFVIMFLSFIWGIFCRYVLNLPQSWTYELQSICFLYVCILSCNLAHRTEEHIVFDLVYEKYSERTKCIMRIISNVLTAVILIPLIPASIRYMQSMKGLLTQVMKLPRFCIFIPFCVMFLVSLLRCIQRAVLDINAFMDKTYIAGYLEEERRKT